MGTSIACDDRLSDHLQGQNPTAGSGSSVSCTEDVSPLREDHAPVRSRLLGVRRVAGNISGASLEFRGASAESSYVWKCIPVSWIDQSSRSAADRLSIKQA